MLYCGSLELNLQYSQGFGCTSFTDHIFSVVCKKSVPHQRPSRFSPMLSWGVLYFMFKSIIYFANSFERYLDSFCCMQMPRCSRNHLLKWPSWLHCIAFDPLLNMGNYISVALCLGSLLSFHQYYTGWLLQLMSLIVLKVL